MKKLILITLLFGFLNSYSQTSWFDSKKSDYFISITGSDSNTGNSPWASWQTLTKLNSEQAAMPDYSRIALKAGNVWSDTIWIMKATLVFKRYSTGVNPEIMRFYNPNNYAYTVININTTTPSNAIRDPGTGKYLIDPGTGKYILDPGITN